jgi:trans-2-enoyl-CoA reductase
VVNFFAGSDVVGQPVTLASTATGLLVPLSTQDIYKVMQEQGVPEGTILTLLSIFGMGMQNFDASKHAKPEKSF